MGSVRRNAPGPLDLIARCGLAVFLGTACSGCAGIGTYRGSDYPFLGGFWDFGKSAEPVLGPDPFAQQMNSARTKAADRQARLEKSTAAGAEPAQDDDAKKDPKAKPDDAAPDGEKKPRIVTSARLRGDGDQDTIRVTLGRPESLPIVTPPGGQAPSRSLMAANTPKWKKEPSAGDRVEAEPNPEHDPAPARTELARASRTRARDEDRGSIRPTADEPSSKRPSNEEKVAEILDKAKSRLESLDAYQVSMSRVERVGGKLQPQEDVLLSIRRAPQAVRLQWDDGPNKGREVIYSTSVDPNVIHVNMANSAIPLPRMSIAVDSPMITKNSRHSIKEAGFDTILSHMSEGSESKSSNGSSGGKVTYKGLVRRSGMDGPCHLFVRNAPNGEKWEVLLDQKTLLPRSVVAEDARGELLEKYIYRDIKENPVELASADAFDPDSRWGKSRGLFSRLAGAAAGGKPTAPSTTR